MATNTISVDMLAKMFLAGAQNIEAKKEYINELNVFPVPDGDTGTNMSLTIMSAAKEVTALEDLTMQSLAKAISSGSLRGARGNSGVILSQLLRGFTKALREEKEVNVQNLAAACERAKETAYKAVMKPKEGTILTVARAFPRRPMNWPRRQMIWRCSSRPSSRRGTQCWRGRRRCSLYSRKPAWWIPADRV